VIAPRVRSLANFLLEVNFLRRRKMAKKLLALPPMIQAEPWAAGKVVAGTLKEIVEIEGCPSRKLVFEDGGKTVACWATAMIEAQLSTMQVGGKYEIVCKGKAAIGKREGWSFEVYELD